MTNYKLNPRQEYLSEIWKISFLTLSALIIFIVTCIWLVKKYESFDDYIVPVLIVVCGILGSYVGMHNKLKFMKDEELRGLANSKFAIMTPALIGGLLALVLYLIFLGKIIEGELFPSFVEDCKCDSSKGFSSIFNQKAAEGYVGYAKLLVWSFVAGYNQKYVVDIIETFQAKREKSKINKKS